MPPLLNVGVSSRTSRGPYLGGSGPDFRDRSDRVCFPRGRENRTRNRVMNARNCGSLSGSSRHTLRAPQRAPGFRAPGYAPLQKRWGMVQGRGGAEPRSGLCRTDRERLTAAPPPRQMWARSKTDVAPAQAPGGFCFAYTVRSGPHREVTPATKLSGPQRRRHDKGARILVAAAEDRQDTGHSVSCYNVRTLVYEEG